MKIRQFMDSQPNKKPTYTVPVAICAAVLVFGSLLLAFLMATRDMAPPRKYEVDMSGSVIGIDTTSKIPVLTKRRGQGNRGQGPQESRLRRASPESRRGEHTGTGAHHRAVNTPDGDRRVSPCGDKNAENRNQVAQGRADRVGRLQPPVSCHKSRGNPKADLLQRERAEMTV